jgi:hypothetical protein
MIFDAKRDAEQIATGNFFYCRGHLAAVELSQQSGNPDYCQTCLKVIQGEKRDNGPSDRWEPDGTFSHFGKRYGLDKNCRTVVIQDKAADGSQGLQDAQGKGVTPAGIHPDTLSKICDKKCLICGSIIPGKKADRQYCSARCRQTASRAGRQLSMI